MWWLLVGLGSTVLALGLLTTGRAAAASMQRVAVLFEEDVQDDAVRAQPTSSR